MKCGSSQRLLSSSQLTLAMMRVKSRKCPWNDPSCNSAPPLANGRRDTLSPASFPQLPPWLRSHSTEPRSSWGTPDPSRATLGEAAAASLAVRRSSAAAAPPGGTLPLPLLLPRPEKGPSGTLVSSPTMPPTLRCAGGRTALHREGALSLAGVAPTGLAAVLGAAGSPAPNCCARAPDSTQDVMPCRSSRSRLMDWVLSNSTSWTCEDKGEGKIGSSAYWTWRERGEGKVNGL